jgi:hypothetical protein
VSERAAHDLQAQRRMLRRAIERVICLGFAEAEAIPAVTGWLIVAELEGGGIARFTGDEVDADLSAVRLGAMHDSFSRVAADLRAYLEEHGDSLWWRETG